MALDKTVGRCLADRDIVLASDRPGRSILLRNYLKVRLGAESQEYCQWANPMKIVPMGTCFVAILRHTGVGIAGTAFTLSRLRFNEKKATQAASRFLKLADGRMNYMKLIKLLYLMDREALLRWARPVTNDYYYSMRLGPVLSEVHDLITEQPSPDQPTFWSTHISDPAHYEVELKSDAGDGELSEAEEDLIQEIHSKYGPYAPFDLVKILHKTLPEWKEVQEGRVPILYSEILAAGNKTPEQIAAIESELDSLSRIQCFARD